MATLTHKRPGGSCYHVPVDRELENWWAGCNSYSEVYWSLHGTYSPLSFERQYFLYFSFFSGCSFCLCRPILPYPACPCPSSHLILAIISIILYTLIILNLYQSPPLNPSLHSSWSQSKTRLINLPPNGFFAHVSYLMARRHEPFNFKSQNPRKDPLLLSLSISIPSPAPVRFNS